MSKNIIIQEGGIGKQLTVDKLKTNLVGGGSCLWVPEDDINLGTKHISENGTYNASDDGYTGYSHVSVNVSGSSVTGKDPDGSGDDAEATVDPETGEIVITKIPSRIEVITPPTNPYGVYRDGQTITKDGMVVKGFTESDVDCGVIPNSEITINPTQAHYDESKDTRGKGTATSELDTGCVQPISYTGNFGRISGDGRTEINYSGRNAAFSTSNQIGAIFASDSSAVAEFTITINKGLPSESTSTGTMQGTATYTYDNKKVYYNYSYFNNDGSSTITHGTLNETTKAPAGPDAWTIVYGDKDEEPAGSPQTINVSWPRPGDGRVLETSFDILVAPGYGGDEGENGNAGTPPPGMLIP